MGHVLSWWAMHCLKNHFQISYDTSLLFCINVGKTLKWIVKSLVNWRRHFCRLFIYYNPAICLIKHYTCDNFVHLQIVNKDSSMTIPKNSRDNLSTQKKWSTIFLEQIFGSQTCSILQVLFAVTKWRRMSYGFRWNFSFITQHSYFI